MGAVVVARGDVWWLETPDDKSRPILVVSRNQANAVMSRVMVAPITRSVRNLPSYLPLNRAEGLHTESAANFDDLSSVPKSYLTRRLGALGPRSHELCKCLKEMAGC